MSGDFKIGAVLHHDQFKFESGTTRNKYLVVLGANPASDYLCALTTTKQWKMKAERGCHHKPRTHFFIPGGGKNYFPRDTWIVLSSPIVMSRVEMIQKGIHGTIEIKANLGNNIAGEIRNCLKASRDISKRQKELL